MCGCIGQRTKMSRKSWQTFRLIYFLFIVSFWQYFKYVRVGVFSVAVDMLFCVASFYTKHNLWGPILLHTFTSNTLPNEKKRIKEIEKDGGIGSKDLKLKHNFIVSSYIKLMSEINAIVFVLLLKTTAWQPWQTHRSILLLFNRIDKMCK